MHSVQACLGVLEAFGLGEGEGWHYKAWVSV